MNPLMHEVKVLRDPIHGYIHIQDEVIWKLLNAPEFQRLHRIHQLGGDFQVYHTAEHSRFSHSLGVYEICRRMCEEIESLKASISRQERTAVLCAALLHDLGHGPFSHFFESITNISHEDITARLILRDSGLIRKILDAEDPGLAMQVVSILNHTADKPLLCDMISSQLDCDRMDYLLRDSYFTGTSYGSFDLERVLRTMRVHNGRLCIKKSGMHSVEDYIMARYQNYWQVYLHPDAYGYELLIFLFFKRYGVIRNELKIDLFEALFEPELDLERFLEMDDWSFFSGFRQASRMEDPILQDLAGRIIDRRLFDWKEIESEEEAVRIERILRQAGYPSDYYWQIQSFHMNEYLPYTEEFQPILVLENGMLEKLSFYSAIAKALLQVKTQPAARVYFPKECRTVVQNS